MTQPVLFHPEYVVLLDGDLAGALLLSQIVYWSTPGKNGKSKLRVFKNGRLWLVKSHQDWTDELGLSRRQSQRALDLLRERNIVKTEVHRFNNVPTVHLLLLDKAHWVHSGSTSKCLLNAPVGAVVEHSEVQPLTETTAETTTENTYALSAQENQVNAQDILKGFKGKQDAVSGTGPQALALVWKKRLGLIQDGFVKQLTGKELGQLKHVHSAVGAQAKDALVFALENWPRFSTEAAARKAVYPAVQPSCGFFCQHYDVALQLIAEDQKKAKALAEFKPPVPQIPVAAPAVAADNLDLAGEAEIAETLAQLKALAKAKAK